MRFSGAPRERIKFFPTTTTLKCQSSLWPTQKKQKKQHRMGIWMMKNPTLSLLGCIEKYATGFSLKCQGKGHKGSTGTKIKKKAKVAQATTKASTSASVKVRWHRREDDKGWFNFRFETE